MRKMIGTGLLAFAIVGLGGCAGAGLTLFGVGAGVSSGTGVNYTLDSIAYKTFVSPEPELRAATLRTLRRMDMNITGNEATESGRKITAVAGDRTVDIELDRITSKTSRMRVNVAKDWLFRDRATAGEIIVQTEKTLDSEVMVSKNGK